MAMFRQHVTFSTVLGVGYAAGLRYLGAEWVHAGLAGGLCGVSGMLPDLDSDSGRPVKELFGALAVGVPFLFLRRWEGAGYSTEATILLGAAVYFAIRFGLAWVFKHVTVHRGMFHSLPAAVIAAEAVYLAYNTPDSYGRVTLAGGVLIGFLSHLLLDEIWAVDANGLTIRLNKAAGSAMKLFSQSIPATLLTWAVLGVLTYLIGVENGYVQPIRLTGLGLPRVSTNSRDIPARIPGSATPGQPTR